VAVAVGFIAASTTAVGSRPVEEEGGGVVEGDNVGQIHDGGDGDFPYAPPAAASASTTAKSTMEVHVASPAATRSVMQAVVASPVPLQR
jgi:hypothetical protein